LLHHPAKEFARAVPSLPHPTITLSLVYSLH
jgi:hypothetical protein